MVGGFRPQAFAAAFLLFTALWARNVVGPRVPGTSRLLLTVPLLPAIVLIPEMLFPEHHTQADHMLGYMLLYFLLGLDLCKVLALCMNRGPLVALMNGSQWRFIGATIMPVAIVADESHHGPGYGSQVTSSSSSKPHVSHVINRDNAGWAAAGSLAKGIAGWGVSCVLNSTMLPPGSTWVPLWVTWGASYMVVQEALMLSATYLTLGWALDAASAIAAICFDVSSTTSFNLPMQSLSLVELWRCRWNVVVSHTFRWLCYEPIVEGCLVRKSGPAADPLMATLLMRGGKGNQAAAGMLKGGGSDGGVELAPAGVKLSRKQAAALAAAAEELERRQGPRRVAGVFAVFVASGCLHELAYWLANQRFTRGLWLAFFTAQAVGVIVQRLVPISPSGLVTMIMRDSKMDSRLTGQADKVTGAADMLCVMLFLLPCLHYLWLPPCKASLQTCFIP